MDLRKYMNLSIPRNEYRALLREWKSKIKPDTDLSFTSWTLAALENVFMRYRFLKAVYPNLKLISTSTDAFVIEDMERKTVVKVFLNDTRIDCTSTENRDDYIVYACLHPLFGLSG